MNDVILDKIRTIRYENKIVIVIDESLTKLVGNKIEFHQCAIRFRLCGQVGNPRASLLVSGPKRVE